MVAKDPKKYHQSGKAVVVAVERLALGGDAVGREITGTSAGRTCFVNSGVPGEEVEVELSEVKKRFSRGHVRRVLQPSDQRVEPPCPIAGVCGGCAWQHVHSSAQAHALEANIQFLFRRLLRENTRVAPLWQGEVLGYRNRLRLHVQWTENGAAMGFRPRQGRGVIPLERCAVAQDGINRMLTPLREALTAGWTNRGRGGTAVLQESSHGDVFVSLRGPWREGICEKLVESGFRGARLDSFEGGEEAGEMGIAYYTGERTPEVSIPLGGFSQANSAGFRQLVEDLLHEWPETLTGGVLELFCGAGTLTVPIRAQHPKGTWVGTDCNAVALEELAERLGDWKIETVLGAHPLDLEEDNWDHVDVVLMDPPREGAKEWMERIEEAAPRWVMYISCNPLTQVRDLEMLPDGMYELSALYSYDMFPMTGHMETLAILRRNEKGEGQ